MQAAHGLCGGLAQLVLLRDHDTLGLRRDLERLCAIPRIVVLRNFGKGEIQDQGLVHISGRGKGGGEGFYLPGDDDGMSEPKAFDHVSYYHTLEIV